MPDRAPVITPFNLLFIKYISIQASAQKVIVSYFTNTRYTAHSRSTIGSALIIAYRHHYGVTVCTIAILSTTHTTRSDRAKCDTSTSTAGFIVGG